MKKSTLPLLAILAVNVLTSCSSAGGSGSPPPPPPPPAFHFSVTAPTTAIIGTAFTFTVTALDTSNNTDTSYSGMVQFTSTDPHAALPATSALANGVGNFSVTLETSGTQSITATDAVTTSITATSKSIIVSATAPLSITSGNPPDGTAGAVYDGRRGAKCTAGSDGCVCIILVGLGTQCRITLKGFPLTAAGGMPPYNWTWMAAANSSLPAGLEIGSINVAGGSAGCCVAAIGIEGAPTTVGTYNVIVTVADSAVPPTQVSANYSIQINPVTSSSTEAASTPDSAHELHRYKLVDLGGTLGGAQSYFVPGSGNAFPGSSVLNNSGKVVGFADTSAPDPFPNVCFWDCNVVHTFEAGANGHLTDLGALPGGGSSVPMWITSNGLVAGISENGELDPLYPGLPQIRAVLWQRDTITDLGTLPEGGFQSEANAVNSSGQVVGSALNVTPDPNSMQQLPDSIGPGGFWLWGGIVPPYLVQTRAFIWDKRDGMRDLGTLGGTDAQAFLINDAGQVAGYSYTSSTAQGSCFPVPTDSFIWEKDKGMRDLGSLGGTCTLVAAMNSRGQIVGESSTTGDQAAPGFLWEHGSIRQLGGSIGGVSAGGTSINEQGEIAGFATLSGEATFHATLWKNPNSITDLGTISGDPCSFAAAINSSGQVVGASSPICDFGDSARAILWQDGALFDLNTLIPSGSAVYLQLTNSINDAGEIAGTGVDANGNQHAFLLIPCDENHRGVDGCSYDLVDPATLVTVKPPQAAEAPASNPPSVHHVTKFGPLMARHNNQTRSANVVSQ
jgi:probable HAF family extracellular repeat protein